MSKDKTVVLMTEGDYRKHILKFAIPVFFGNLFQTMYSVVDSMVVGNYLGPQALAAISSNGALIGLMIGLFLGFGSGTSVVVGQMLGAGDSRRTSDAVHSTVALGLLFSVMLTALGVLCGRNFLQWMGTPADVIDLSAVYLKIYFSGAFALVMYNLLTGVLQAAGNSRDPLIYLIVSSVLNTVLDLLFVAVFHWGVAGAALATVISEAVSALLVLIKLMRTDSAVKIILSKVRFEKTTTKEILRIGAPNSVEWAVIDLANVMIQSYINSFGAMAMAGYGAAQKIEGFAFIPLQAMRAALATYVSQNYGAGEYERIKKGVRFGITTGVLVIVAIGVFVHFNAESLIGLFNDDPDVVYYGVTRMHICAIFFAVLGFSNIMSSVINSLGKPMISMFTMLFCWCAVRVLVLNTIGRIYHVYWLCCIIYPITWSLSSLVLITVYRHLSRTLIKTTE